MHSLWLILLINASSADPAPAPAESGTATRTLTLREAVELGLRTTPEVGQAAVGRDRAELAVLRAQLDRFSVKVDAQLQELYAKTGIGTDEASFSGGLGLSNISANVNVPLFSGFRVESNVDRAKETELASAEDIKATKRGVALAIARSYWAARKIALLAEVESSALTRLRGAEEIAASRVRAGLAPPIDQNRAIARRLTQEITLADLLGQLRETTASLAVALGIDVPILLTETPAERDRLPAIAAALEDAHGARPEIAAARARFAAQTAAVDIAKSSYYPQLSAFSLFQYGNNPTVAGAGSRAVSSDANPFKNMAGDFQAGVTLSMNFFDTLNTDTAVRDARFEESRLGLEIERLERVVDSEVRGAHARVAHFRDISAKLAPVRVLARDNVDIVQKRYENGEAAVFELLDTEIELLNIERRLTDTASDLSLAWLELDASLGNVVGE